MTEAEAKTKWCPMVRFVIGPQSSTWQESALDNRSGMTGESRCLASGCMAWRTHPGASDYQRAEPTGYCGLAGKP